MTGARRALPREDELLLRLVHDVVDYAIFVLDPSGMVASWNTGAERLKGYQRHEIVGRHFSCFYPKTDVDEGKPDRELAIAMADGRFEEEGLRMRRDGSTFWASVVITALRGDDGRLLGFGKVTRDLSERRRGESALRDSEERFRLLVSSVTDYAIYLLTPEGLVASWNQGAQRLKGYQADEIIGRPFSRFYSEQDQHAGIPDEALAEALERGRWESEGWRIRRDGTRFWASVVITALHGDDGRHRGFAKVTQDMTDRKRSRDALVGVLERERSASARLAALDRMKNELVAVIAHDLRGPVGVIQNLLHLLHQGWDTMPDDEKLALLDRTAHRADSVGELVDDVFDVARIEAGQLSVQTSEFDVGHLVAEAVADVHVTAPGRAVVARIDERAMAVGDARRCGQVLANLLSNALKFSPADTPIEVTVRRDAHQVLVTVADRGAGIADHQHEMVFRPFVRLGDGTDATGAPGSGLGLFIARSLVEAQGGRMWLDSGTGRGTTFGFSLPGPGAGGGGPAGDAAAR